MPIETPFIFGKIAAENKFTDREKETVDPDYFQKKLRSHWQLHQCVAYCLYGSKHLMMMEVFTYSSPFYKSGNRMFLNKIKTPCLVEFFKSRFADNGQLSLLFVTITKTLTTQQLNYLNALIAGEKAISSTEVMHRYLISSATSVSRSKAALIKNDILDNKAGKISFRTRFMPTG